MTERGYYYFSTGSDAVRRWAAALSPGLAGANNSQVAEAGSRTAAGIPVTIWSVSREAGAASVIELFHGETAQATSIMGFDSTAGSHWHFPMGMLFRNGLSIRSTVVGALWVVTYSIGQADTTILHE